MKMAENSFIVSSVEYDSTCVRPVICNFQNGKIPEGFEQHMTSQVYRDADNDLVVAVAANKQLYTKKITTNKTHNTFIAIPNSKRTKVRLIAVDHVKLAPHIEDDVAASTTAVNLNTTMEFRDKKAKRILSERSKLKQNVESIDDHLRETVAGILVNEDLNASISDSSYRPKLDAEAESVEDIYSLHDLVPKKVLESLTKEVERIFNSESAEEWGTCEFVTQMLNNIEDIDSQENITTCQIWLYIDCLIKFLTTIAKIITGRRYKACTYSELADNEILQNFTVTGTSGRTRPTIMKDKATCYVMVLCLLNSNNYSMDMSRLANEGFVSSKRILEFARVLRFTVKGNTVALKLPLPVVVQAIGKGKRK